MDINDLVLPDEALAVIDSGTWVGDFDEAPGVSFLVLGMQSKDAKESLESKQAAIRAKNRGKALSNKQTEMCVREVLAEVVLKDWSGFKDGGKELKFDRALAKKWMMSRNGERLVGLVLQAAQQVDGHARDFVEEAAKN